MKKFKVGVLGCGWVSSYYRDAFLKMADTVEICFAVDTIGERAKGFAENFPGCGWSDTIEDMLCQPLDAVHVLTPHYLHKEHACRLMRAGFHVLTEKPIAITLEDADEMAAVSRKTGKSLGVVSQNRYIEGIREAKRLIRQGALGKITGAWSTLNWWCPPAYYQGDWKGTWDKEGGGVVIDRAIHSLDLVRYLMGCEAQSVQSHMDTRILRSVEVEDVADAAIVFENGAVYSFFACNYFTCNSPIRVELSGENGSILLKENKVTIEIGGESRVISPKHTESQTLAEAQEDYHYFQISDFYNCIAQGRSVSVDPVDAKKTLELVLGIYQSSREGRIVYFE